MSVVNTEIVIVQPPGEVDKEVEVSLNQDDQFDLSMMEKPGQLGNTLVETTGNEERTLFENSQVKTESLAGDEEGEFGFVVIKPEMEDESSQSQENEQKEDCDNLAPNVYIIQGPDNMNIEGFDPEMISQVRRVLAESGAENSVMILNEGDESCDEGKSSATYVIDLNSVDQPTSVSDTNELSVSMQLPHQNVVMSSLPAPVSSLPSSSSSSIFKPLVNTSDTSASDILNQLVSLSNNTDQSSSDSCVTASRTVGNASIDKSSTTSSATTITSPNALPKNLSTLSMGNKSPPGPGTSNLSSTATVATSQVAEQLMHIAKRMIEDSSQGSQNISVDESQGKIVISSPELKRPGEKSSSDSVITMYLSSPNDLKMKLKKLKTNSPVIVMQAGEDLSSMDDNKENPLHISSSDADEMTVERNPSSNQDSDSAGGQRTDGLAAALSSLTSGGVLYRCSECGYSSHNKHYYKQHVDLVHNEERPYKCPHCDYAGKRRHALLEHMVVHSNQRPYSCSHCNASFRKKGHLTNHVKLHMSHRLVHCGVCNIQLPDAEAFESHLRKIHNTDKLYKCKLCEHTVVDRRAMLTHLATHNETIVFSCPNCPSYFNDESSLLSHMKESHSILKKPAASDQSVQKTNFIGKTIQTPPATDKNASTSGSDNSTRPANIVCSACGFICADTQVMKKHMWVHMDSSAESGVQLKDRAAASKKNEGDKNSNSAMGVLKMNVVSGMKSLPENIVYQCTSCQFTSNDNSVFIKHMLLHKTQRKQQTPAAKTSTSSQAKTTNTVESKPVTPVPKVSSMGSSLPARNVTSKEKKPDSSVPFVFDQDSGRYRCLICGYHCDFQRTIKAHIWKHSGNQHIEYPVFEQVGKSDLAVQANMDPANKVLPRSDTIAKESDLSTCETPQLSSQTKYLNPGHTQSIQTLPFIPPACRPKPLQRQLSQGRECPLDVSLEELHVSHPDQSNVTTLLTENIVSPCHELDKGKENEVEVKPVSSSTSADLTSSPTLIIEEKSEIALEISHQSDDVAESGKTPDIPFEHSVDKIKRFEGCTEPSVVVEIVDSVPSSLGLTGMKSQQGSPRVSDLEGSGNEAKFHKEMLDLKQQVSDVKVNILKPGMDAENVCKSKYDLRKPRECVIPGMTSNKLKRYLAAKSDLLKSDDVVPDNKTVDDVKYGAGKKIIVDSKEDVDTFVKEEGSDLFSNEESDGTTSSEETVSAGESNSANPPKSGICSSLLAVIEQLRERSRSESERDLPTAKELPKRLNKRGKKSNTATETASLSEFHNIEKISEGGGEKFRCSLCHYTSQRICNMKIHMKTHRQKKPSECSLCDFASASPELLQEHMLQHCKVRTYACKFCPQSFNHKSTLRAHMRAHKDHEPFLCAYCVFETTNPNEYREHMHVHSGCSSRLRCPGCDFIMNSKDELTPHLMKCKGKPPTPSSSTVAGKGGETKPLEPSKSPKNKDSLNDAKNPKSFPATAAQPTQHSCVVSGCSFSSISLKELQDHLSVHCNPSLMVCDLCDFKALHSRSLKSHMKRHANDQRYVSQPLEQYKCNLCGYVCHHLPSLKSHMWRHASDQSYSYEFTNDVINAAIDHDSRVDVNKSQPDDPELLVQFINSESRIMEGELTNYGKGDGQRPTCWVTFRCCSCGFETINKAKLNIHMRSHSDIIQQSLDAAPRKPGVDKSNHFNKSQVPLTLKPGSRRSLSTEENNEPSVPQKVRKAM